MLELEKLRASEVRGLPKDRAIVFIPVGPLEDHGDLLPLGLDLSEARAVCERTAKLFEAEGWTAVFAPAAPLSIDSNTSGIAIRVRAHVLRDYLVDFCDSLTKVGFRKFVAVSGNLGPKQLTAIEEAGTFLRKRHLRFGIFPGAFAPVLVSGSSVLVEGAEKSRSPFFMFPEEHGGARDVSIALALGYDASAAKTLPKVDADPSNFSHWQKWRKGEIAGYWGNPASGSAAEGNRVLDEKAKTLAVKLKAAFEGGKPRHIFKSWYSVVPTNRSLFRIWVLVAMLAILLAAWTFLSVQTFLSGADFTP
jgi:creatinine amidohydrolase/Fe(II)-dependent formamide hydrolase-like protein